MRQLERDGIKFERSLVETLGSGASVAGVKLATSPDESLETVLRVSVADPNREKVEHFAKKIAPLVTAGPQGVTGYSSGRPKVQAVFGYWPCLIDKELVEQKIDMLK